MTLVQQELRVILGKLEHKDQQDLELKEQLDLRELREILD